MAELAHERIQKTIDKREEDSPSIGVSAPYASGLLAPHRDELRHRILPWTVCERTLTGTIGVHNEDGSVGLECVVVERGFIPPSIHAAVPQDVLAVRAIDIRLAKAGALRSEDDPFAVRGIGCVIVE